MSLISLAKQLGVYVVRTQEGPRLRGPKNCEWLAREIAKDRESLDKMLNQGDSIRERESEKTPLYGNGTITQLNPKKNEVPLPLKKGNELDYPTNLAGQILGLTLDDLPSPPFGFGPGVEVTYPGRFLAWLKHDVQLGIKSPRAMTGVLQDDMRRLVEIVAQRMEES